MKKSTGSKYEAYIEYIHVPDCFKAHWIEYVQLSNYPENDGKLRRQYEEVNVTPIFDSTKHNPTRRNFGYITIFCYKGDCQDGLAGHPPLWFLYSKWIMFKLEPLHNFEI